jgi:TIR domain
VSQPIEIFCCVAESDRPLLSQLVTQLAPQPRQDIKLWDNSHILPGANADEEIRQHLTSARVFLLLISPDFLADDYCYNRVMKAALERHTRGETLTIPVIVRPAHWENVPILNTIQPIPRNGQPIKEQSSQDKALFEVVQEINMTIQRLAQGEPTSRVFSPELSPFMGKQHKIYFSKRNNINIITIFVVIIISLGMIVAFTLYPKDEVRRFDTPLTTCTNCYNPLKIIIESVTVKRNIPQPRMIWTLSLSNKSDYPEEGVSFRLSPFTLQDATGKPYQGIGDIVDRDTKLVKGQTEHSDVEFLLVPVKGSTYQLSAHMRNTGGYSDVDFNPTTFSF